MKGTLKNRYFHQSSDSKPLIVEVYCRRKPYFSKCPKHGNSGVKQVRIMSKFPITIKGKQMVRIPTYREPTHPGEMLREEFLEPMNISQRDLANAIHTSYQRINELVNQKRGITPSTALRLGKFFGVSADFWLNLQIRWDLFKAQAAERKELESIKEFRDIRKIA